MDQAHHALIDPLIEPDPSDETGLNTHFRSTFGPQEPITPPGATAPLKATPAVKVQEQHTGTSTETNPYRRSRASSETKNPFGDHQGPSSPGSRRYEYPSPPTSASPRREHFPSSHRSVAFGSLNEEARPRRSSNPAPSQYQSSRIGRSGSLSERYPGDKSHRPLDTIRQEEKLAYRAPHLRKKNFQGADVIDRLDVAGFSRYHHEGPYDAASIARNKHVKYPPIEAVQESNEAALRATPQENIVDAVRQHRPLEGVANTPPGLPDRFGRVLDYEEGADLQREPGGDFGQVGGVDYYRSPERSNTIDKNETGTEMTSRHRHTKSLGHVETTEADASGVGRSNSKSLKSRLGSIRRRKHHVEA